MTILDPNNARKRRLAIACLGGFLLLSYVVSSSSSSATQHRHQRRTLLGDGLTECASCPNDDKLFCSGTTINDEFCAPCATGQLWWPCNIIDECYCKDLAAAAAEAAAAAAAAATSSATTTTTTVIVNDPIATTTTTVTTPPCDIPLCQPGEYTPTKIVPFTNCTQYTSCSAGTPGILQTCPSGQAYSTQISACNIVDYVVCMEDPPCPTTTETEVPTASPVMIVVESVDDVEVTMDDSTINAPPPRQDDSGVITVTGDVSTGRGSETPLSGLHPSIIEGMYVIDAHMAANKIALARNLLTGPTNNNIGNGRNNEYSFASLRSSLHYMITTGVANQTFYIGQDTTTTTNGEVASASASSAYAYGLVNIAAFVSMSAEDSISRGSCDEVNINVVEGVLPFSNACGQFGLNYQEDLQCDDSESMYDCKVDMDMRMVANDHPMMMSVGADGSKNALPKPFFCGPKSDYGGSSGFWDYVNGVESMDAAESEIGRQDVEGCCWWGRGSLHLRGTCAYGKLNYFLGKRAADEGRQSLFPDIDFCRNPQAICADTRYSDLKWIAGLFRWVTEIQPYNSGGFNYVQRLMEFVDGGLQDWSFIQGVSGIVTQGCHEPPCRVGAEVLNGTDRVRTFIKTLKILGLPVKDGTIVSVEASR